MSFVDKIASLGGAISALLLVLMMLLITTDVLGRYFFSKPTYVADELSGYALVAITFLALSQTEKLNKHMRVTSLVSQLSPKIRKWLGLITAILTLLFAIWFTWSTSVTVIQIHKQGIISLSIMHTPQWTVHTLLPIGLSMFVLASISNITKRILSWSTT